MEPQDFFTDHVVRSGPVLGSFGGESTARLSQAERRDVVEERINPYIDDVLLIARKRNAPREVGARDGYILQTVAQSAEHFVAARSGLHKVRIGGEEVFKLLLK